MKSLLISWNIVFNHRVWIHWWEEQVDIFISLLAILITIKIITLSTRSILLLLIWIFVSIKVKWVMLDIIPLLLTWLLILNSIVHFKPVNEPCKCLRHILLIWLWLPCGLKSHVDYGVVIVNEIYVVCRTLDGWC